MRISDWSSDVCSSDLLICGRWSHFNGQSHVVLMGDAAHTAHFAIGSGTKLAIDDAIEIGRASCRERVCQYVLISVVAVSLEKKKRSLILPAIKTNIDTPSQYSSISL